MSTLAADDPRHGTYAGAVAHWFTDGNLCGPCKQAETRYRKTRKLRALHGERALVPAVGTLRRVRALHALGWTGPQIAEGIGISINTIRSITYQDIRTIRSTTANTVRDGYERMAMTIPEGPYANRTRLMAERRGWPPPLAWDDIDDENEVPTDWQRSEPRGGGWCAPDRHGELDDLIESGAWLSEACRVLDISPVSLEKWMDRHGRRSDFNLLMNRERGAA